MGTRSRIGIEEEDGSVRSVYIHWDGYPSHVGALAKEHYSDPDKLRELINGGGISALGKEIGLKHDMDRCTMSEFEKIRKMGWTSFYHRDRGESLSIQTHKSRKDYMENWGDAGEEYIYLFSVKNKTWYYSKGSSNRLTKLTDRICKKD